MEHYHETEETSKYNDALALYTTPMTDEQAKSRATQIAEKYVTENNTTEVKKLIFNCLDLTTLKTEDSEESVLKFTERVNEFDTQYPDLKNVAAICVYPCFAKIVSQSLEVEDVNVACVSGGFPSSQTFTEVKVAETALALADGATEIDIVIPVGKFLSGDYEGMCDEIEELKAICGERHLKVILETGALKIPQLIHDASLISMLAGTDFIKTSTGKIDVAATPEAAFIMCHAIKDYYKETGRKVGFKAAGGVKTPEDAALYYTIVEEILGEEWLTTDLFRIGASSAANNLLSGILGEKVSHF